MTHVSMKSERKPPLWAALGAPLVGVPLMVGLLALGAPKQEAPASDATPGLLSEPVDTHQVEPASNDSAAKLEEALSVG